MPATITLALPHGSTPARAVGHGPGDVESVARAITEFIGARVPAIHSREFAAIAFVDIVDSTAHLRRHGDQRWLELLAAFHTMSALEIKEFGGRIVKTIGDGLLATFRTASDAIASQQLLVALAASFRLGVRGAVHAAEVERIGDDVFGVGVHVAARVEALATPGEVWVTRTVRDLVAGSGFRLDDRGEHVLRGFEEPWQLYAVAE